LDGEARSAGTVSTVSYVLAGVGMAAGVVMLLLDSPNEASGQSATTVLPWVGYRSAGVAGRF
jgi:hypothetical protein